MKAKSATTPFFENIRTIKAYIVGPSEACGPLPHNTASKGNILYTSKHAHATVHTANLLNSRLEKVASCSSGAQVITIVLAVYAWVSIHLGFKVESCTTVKNPASICHIAHAMSFHTAEMYFNQEHHDLHAKHGIALS